MCACVHALALNQCPITTKDAAAALHKFLHTRDAGLNSTSSELFPSLSQADCFLTTVSYNTNETKPE